MNGQDDAPPVRLAPHPADERLAVLRVDRHAEGLGSFIDDGPRRATFLGRLPGPSSLLEYTDQSVV
jgi:hypothetical protein